MIYDKTTNISHSMIQHGGYSDRVYLMKLSEKDNKEETLEKVIHLARKNKYGKVFAKINAQDSGLLKKHNFECEAKIPDFFNGKEDSEFHSLFLKKERREDNFSTIRENLDLASQKKNRPFKNEGLDVVELTKESIPSITKIYSKVFKTYPFPIFDDDFVAESLESHVRIFSVIENGQIAALASCEIDFDSKNVEMTDFATVPGKRASGMAQKLLVHMEKKMKEAGMKTSYTIARSLSPGMNITFSKCGYSYGGTLKNNTNISGAIQSMNVWYKNLRG
jgi:putative beta-lysine N-acetyltransferase